MVGMAIKSALQQTFHDIEVIVVDNASTDGIEDVIRSFDDPRLRFFKNNENLGIFGNFNRCIDESCGEFIHILHSDDYIDTRFTELCVRFFDEHPDVMMTFTSACIQTPDLIQELKYADNDTIFKAPEGFRRLLLERSFIPCPSVMLRKDLYPKIGKFSLDLPYSSDFYQWLKIARSFDIAYIRDAVIYYRQGEHSESHRLLFLSPFGYFDALKIFMRLRDDLSGEIGLFAREYNAAQRRFIIDSAFAGFTRVDRMSNYHPSLFAGLAMSSWALLEVRTINDLFKKWMLLIFILGAGFLMHFSIVRNLAKHVLYKKMQLY